MCLRGICRVFNAGIFGSSMVGRHLPTSACRILGDAVGRNGKLSDDVTGAITITVGR